MAGDEESLQASALFPRVYERLHAQAAKYLRDFPDRALDPAALVHEVYLRLQAADQAGALWESREHFLAVAARAMRQILIDEGRRRGAGKRGGGWARVTLTGLDDAKKASMTDVIALGDALDELAKLDPRQSEIVSLRLFGGLTVPQIAARLGLSDSSVEKEWRRARALLASRVRAALPE